VLPVNASVADENKEARCRIYAAMNAHGLAALAALIHRGFVPPDFHVMVEDVIAEGTGSRCQHAACSGATA
jgi:hypothetical protein